MLVRALQFFAKRGFFSLLAILLSAPAFSESINIVIKDQHGQVLPNAVLELTQSRQPTAAINLPTAVMDQVDKQFSPKLLIVKQGQSVNFPNSDNIRHHVYSFSKAKPFQLKLYSGEPKAPIKFERQGVVVLGCNIHDSMVGYIYVTNSELVYISDEQGRIVLPADLLPRQASVWHSLQRAPLDKKKMLNINSNGALLITINTSMPAPRNTFGSQFRDRDGQ